MFFTFTVHFHVLCLTLCCDVKFMTAVIYFAKNISLGMLRFVDVI